MCLKTIKKPKTKYFYVEANLLPKKKKQLGNSSKTDLALLQLYIFQLLTH